MGWRGGLAVVLQVSMESKEAAADEEEDVRIGRKLGLLLRNAPVECALLLMRLMQPNDMRKAGFKLTSGYLVLLQPQWPMYIGYQSVSMGWIACKQPVLQATTL